MVYISESDEHDAEQVSRKAVHQGSGLCRAWARLTCFSCPRRSSGAKKQQAHESSRPLSIERPGAVHPWVSAQLRSSVQPSHLFIQDPTMPPNPAPNPLTQLEEARRRLEEEEKRASKAPSKQRCVVLAASVRGGSPSAPWLACGCTQGAGEAHRVCEWAWCSQPRGGALVSHSRC